jgi:hypothetical protein
MISILFGLVFGVYITTILPLPLGYIKQKIEREILNTLDRIHYKKYFTHIDSFSQHELTSEIENADLRGLYRIASEYDVNVDDWQFCKMQSNGGILRFSIKQYIS